MLLRFVFQFLIIVVTFALAQTAKATPLNEWRISCGVDNGAIVKKGKTRTFRTSSNHCPGGTFNQRAEISTGSVPPNHKGTYLFSSTISMSSTSRERFDVFQIHDERWGCAPPLKLEVMGNGRLSLDSEYKIGSAPGDNCRKNRPFSDQASQARIQRDGTEYLLEVVVDFDGAGGFRIWIRLDGSTQITGQYAPPRGQGYFDSKKFYFKHGVYSKNMFPYELKSTNMRVRRVKLK